MSELLERATTLLERCADGEEMEVYLSEGVDTEVRAYQGEVEHLASSSSSCVGVRVLRRSEAGAAIGVAWAGSLDDESVVGALNDARDNARFAVPDEFVDFARPDGVAPTSLDLCDASVLSTSTAEKIALAVELEKRVRESDPRIRQVESADYSDFVARAALASTHGIRAEYARSGAVLSVEAIANDGRGDETGWGLSVSRAPGGLDPDVAASDAIRRATSMLGAVKAPSAKCVAVFEPRPAATLLALVGGALSGDAVARGLSLFAGRVGEAVAAPTFTLLDDPSDPRHFSASVYDGEGLACRRNVFIRDGRLETFAYDTYAARRAGTAATGCAVRGGLGSSPSAGCRALQLAPGTLGAAEIWREVDEGVLVTSLLGVHSGVNMVSGDFSVGVRGFMIRGGEVAEPIREVTIASTIQRMLLDLSHVGGDVEWLPGSAAAPTIAISSLALSGA